MADDTGTYLYPSDYVEEKDPGRRRLKQSSPPIGMENLPFVSSFKNDPHGLLLLEEERPHHKESYYKAKRHKVICTGFLKAAFQIVIMCFIIRLMVLNIYNC
jgi:hypothetical protein